MMTYNDTENMCSRQRRVFFKIAIACVCVILNERTMNHTATVIEHVTVCAMCYMGNEMIIYSVT